MDDMISRQAAIDALCDMQCKHDEDGYALIYRCDAADRINVLPSAQPEPISEAYMKAVYTWLLDYQIKVVSLKGKYSPYEVLGWVTNDWRKEHE